MADILSIDPIEKSPTLNFIKKTWRYLNSLDKFTKLMVVSIGFIILSTPFIVANKQTFISKGQETTSLITATSLTTGKGSSTATTSTVTIGANKLALIWVTQADGGGGTPSLSDSNRTWTQIATVTPGLRRVTLYRSMNLVDTTGAITIASPTSTGLAWTLVEYGNTDTSGTNGSGAIAQFASRTYKDAGTGRSLSGSISLALSSNVGSAVVGGFAMGPSSPVFPGAGYTLTGGNPCSTVCVQAEFRDNFAQLVDMSWTSLVHWMVIAVELKPLFGVAPTPTSSVPTSTPTPTPIPDPNLTPTPTPTLAPTSASISANTLTTGRFRASDSNPVTASTATVTIQANKLALLWVAQANSNGGSPTVSDPNRTWQQVDYTPGTLRRVTLFRSMSPISTSGVVTINSTGGGSAANSIIWTVVEYSNTDTSGTNGSGAIAQFAHRTHKDAGGSKTLSGSVSLAPSSQTNSAVAASFAIHQNGLPLFSGNGYTLTGAVLCATVCEQAEFRNNFSQLADMSWTNLSDWMVVAVELKAAQ